MTADTRAVLGYALLCASIVGFAALRILGVKSPAFQASAHLFVAFLFGVWWGEGRPARPLLWLAVLLSLVELACFLLGVGGRS